MRRKSKIAGLSFNYATRQLDGLIKHEFDGSRNSDIEDSDVSFGNSKMQTRSSRCNRPTKTVDEF